MAHPAVPAVPAGHRRSGPPGFRERSQVRAGAADPPAGERRTGNEKGPRRTQEDGGNAAGLGRELQPTQRDRSAAGGFAQHRRRSAAAQSLFHAPQNVAIAARPDQDQPRGIKAQSSEAGAVKSGFAPAPDDGSVLSRQPGQHDHAKAGSGPAFVRGGHLMQAGLAKTAPQGVIHSLDAEGNRDSGGNVALWASESAGILKTLNLGAKIGDQTSVRE